jgi:hypothetical protein
MTKEEILKIEEEARDERCPSKIEYYLDNPLAAQENLYYFSGRVLELINVMRSKGVC